MSDQIESNLDDAKDVNVIEEEAEEEEDDDDTIEFSIESTIDEQTSVFLFVFLKIFDCHEFFYARTIDYNK
jgi:signal recognition particle receptor subunit beta